MSEMEEASSKPTLGLYMKKTFPSSSMPSGAVLPLLISCFFC